MIGSGLSGKDTTPQEQEAIGADCCKWLTVCQGLKKDFRELRKDPDWSSEEFQEKALDMLAQKYALSEQQIRNISVLPWKLTPWQMMLRLVAGKYFLGEKRVETIYHNWRQEHPECRAKTRKVLTTLVAERTL
jgi:hypothetical protein